VKTALSKAEIVSSLATRFTRLKSRDRQFNETLSTGLREVDSVIGGIPRGAITEITGPPSSGRTSLTLSTLAEATKQDEFCAIVDTTDSLDALSASAAGITLDQLLWVRCAANVEHAFKSADFLLQGGGFGLIVLDIGDVPSSYPSRIVSSWWYRFRRAVEDTRTSLIVVGQHSCARSAASLIVEMKKEQSTWTTTSDLLKQRPPPTHTISTLLRGTRLHVERQKPVFLSDQKAWFAAQVSYRIS
jgi:hypothetical protein